MNLLSIDVGDRMIQITNGSAHKVIISQKTKPWKGRFTPKPRIIIEPGKWVMVESIPDWEDMVVTWEN